MSFRAVPIVALHLFLAAFGCGARPSAPGDTAPASAGIVAKVPIDVLVTNTVVDRGNVRVDMILKNTGAAPVPHVAIETAPWGETATSYRRGAVSTHNLDIRLPPGSLRFVSVEVTVPESMPAPLSFIALRARAAGGAPGTEDPSLAEFRRLDIVARERFQSYASLPGLAIASVHDRVITRLVTSHRSQAPTGFVLRLRGTIENLYSEDVHGVRYRVKFLERDSASARILGVDKIERHAMKIPAGESRALSVEVESSYVGVRGFSFVLEAWPMKLGGAAIAPPEGW